MPGPVPNREADLARPRARKGSEQVPVTKGRGPQGALSGGRCGSRFYDGVYHGLAVTTSPAAAMMLLKGAMLLALALAPGRTTAASGRC